MILSSEFVMDFLGSGIPIFPMIAANAQNTFFAQVARQH